MIALRKTLAAGALAFGLVALYGGTAGATSSHNNWHKNDNGKAHHASYDQHKDKDHDYYCMPWEGGFKNHDGYNKHHGNNHDYGMKHDDNKGHGDYDKKHYGNNDWGHNDRSHEVAYVKDEHKQESHSEKSAEHEKKASSVEYASHDSNDYGHGWKGGSSEQAVVYKAAESSEKSVEASVEATVDQRTTVNNYTYINGDNNVVNNNISVANTATLEQSASASEATSTSVEYAASNSNQGHGWKGDDSMSSVSYKAEETSEKSSSSEVKQASSYTLNESYTQVENDDHSNKDWGHGYGHDNYNKDHKDHAYNQQHGQNHEDDDCYRQWCEEQQRCKDEQNAHVY